MKKEDPKVTQMLRKIAIEKINVDTVMNEMRLEPEYSKEKMDNSFVIDYVALPKEGGVLTYVKGLKEPVKGYPHSNTLSVLWVIKAMSMAIVSSIYKPWRLYSNFESQAWKVVRALRLKPGRYCPAVQELYKSIPREQLRDIVCIVLQFDDAYRYRFQDAFSEIDKKKPLRSILRAISNLKEREDAPHLIQKWTALRLLFLLTLLSRKARKGYREFVSKLGDVSLDEADEYHFRLKKQYYDIGGVRQKKRKEEFAELVALHLSINNE